jgi:hypothetical protein
MRVYGFRLLPTGSPSGSGVRELRNNNLHSAAPARGHARSGAPGHEGLPGIAGGGLPPLEAAGARRGLVSVLATFRASLGLA